PARHWRRRPTVSGTSRCRKSGGRNKMRGEEHLSSPLSPLTPVLEFPAEDQQALQRRRLLGQANQRREVDVHLLERRDLEARSDQNLRLVQTAVVFLVFERHLHFGA